MRAKCCIHSPVQNVVQLVARVIRRSYERPVQRIVQCVARDKTWLQNPQRQCINTSADARSTYLIRRDFEGLYRFVVQFAARDKTWLQSSQRQCINTGAGCSYWQRRSCKLCWLLVLAATLIHRCSIVRLQRSSCRGGCSQWQTRSCIKAARSGDAHLKVTIK